MVSITVEAVSHQSEAILDFQLVFVCCMMMMMMMMMAFSLHARI